MTGLFGSGTVEVAIGLVFMYLLIGLIVSVSNELIALVVSLRATTLEEGLRQLKGAGPDSHSNSPNS